MKYFQCIKDKYITPSAPRLVVWLIMPLLVLTEWFYWILKSVVTTVGPIFPDEDMDMIIKVALLLAFGLMFLV